MTTGSLTDRNGSANRRGALSGPLAELHSEVDRLFGDFMGDLQPWYSPRSFWNDGKSGLVPKVDVSETDKKVQVTADLPGIHEKDIEVTLSEGVLTIKGERKAEKEEKGVETSFHRLERSYGLYQRSIALPAEVEENKVKAEFSNGVLTITMPKSAKAKSKVKKIAVKSA